MPAFEPSVYQKDIFDWVENKEGNAVVEAAAGAGKSTTLVQAAALLPKKKKALFCAFNKHIALELAEKLKAVGSKMACRTIHQLGRGGLNSALKRRGVSFNLSSPDDRKYLRLADAYVLSTMAKEYEDLREAWYDLLDQEDEEDEDKKPFPAFDAPLFSGYLSTLVRFRRLTLTDPSEPALRALALHYDLSIDFKDEMEDTLFWPLVARGVEVVVAAGAKEYEDLGWIDFTDMVFLPIYLHLPTALYDWIFIDEAQDLNACQLELVLRACRDDGRLLFCGDEHQSMYAFTGSDTESMRTIIKRCNATVLPLSRCYRCPTSHISLAQQVYANIEATPFAGPGLVQIITAGHANQIARARDYFVCRTNAPLVSRCFALIREGVKAVVLGRDLGKNFVDLLKKLSKKRGYSFESLVEIAEAYQREQEQILSQSKEGGNDLAIAAIQDKVSTLKALRLAYLNEVGLGAGHLRGFQDFILNFFKPETDNEGKRIDYSSFVVLSTIHKAKGLEANRVFIESPELLPHPAAKPGWQSTQERNILYVALTRAKQELYFIETAPASLELSQDAVAGGPVTIVAVHTADETDVSIYNDEFLVEDALQPDRTLPVSFYHDEIALAESPAKNVPVPTSNTLSLAFKGSVEMPLTEGRVSRAVAIEVLCPLCSGVCVDPATGSVTLGPELVGHTVICGSCKRACIVPLNAFSMQGNVIAREKPAQVVPNSQVEKKGRTQRERKSAAGRKTKGSEVRQPMQLSLDMRVIKTIKAMRVNASALFEELLQQYDPFVEMWDAMNDDAELDHDEIENSEE
jgi:DNA helicase II / ATP-dependent DNA helicase PcrA